MKNIKLLFLLFTFCTGICSLNAQVVCSNVYDNLKLKSSVLGKEVGYSLYLPSDYDSSERSYPVLYLLHGYSDNHIGWLQFGEMKAITDKAIAEGLATQMIIVMPDAGVSWYVNDYQGKVNYEDFFIQELIPYIESNYRCRGTGKFRAIAGLSMGGYGSLLYALKYPEMFTACCPLSAAVYTETEILNMDSENEEYRFSGLYGKGVGEKRLTEHWKKNSILEIIKNMPDNKKQLTRFYIDCGDDDFLYRGNAALHTALRDARIPHEFRMRDGGHTWEYWRTALPEVLYFISESFHRF